MNNVEIAKEIVKKVRHRRHKTKEVVAKNLPKAVWEGSFNVFGGKLRCYVLDNGQRIINKEDLEELFCQENQENWCEDQEGLIEFYKWQKGGVV